MFSFFLKGNENLWPWFVALQKFVYLVQFVLQFSKLEQFVLAFGSAHISVNIFVL